MTTRRGFLETLLAAAAASGLGVKQLAASSGGLKAFPSEPAERRWRSVIARELTIQTENRFGFGSFSRLHGSLRLVGRYPVRQRDVFEMRLRYRRMTLDFKGIVSDAAVITYLREPRPDETEFYFDVVVGPGAPVENVAPVERFELHMPEPEET